MNKDTPRIPEEALAKAASTLPRPQRKREKAKYTTMGLSQQASDALEYFKKKYAYSANEALRQSIPEELSDSWFSLMEKLGPDFFNPKVRKSILISSAVKDGLSRLVERTGHSRDYLVNFFLVSVHLLSQRYDEKRIESLRPIKCEINEISRRLDQLEARAWDILGADDPVAIRLGELAVVAMNLDLDLDNELEGGEPVPERFI